MSDTQRLIAEEVGPLLADLKKLDEIQELTKQEILAIKAEVDQFLAIIESKNLEIESLRTRVSELENKSGPQASGG